ncbi:MAG: hypothetical protein R3E32_22155 [Chitinophagales bacterium]
MKDKIVFWGTNEKNQNVLVTLRLRAADNKVDIWMFEKSTVSQEFVDKMFEDWDNIEVDTLPEPYEYLEHDMSSPSILPDTILANNTEMINRAEKEWYVKILASKLAMKLEEEVVQLVKQVGGMEKYDKDVWTLAKDYWDKINQHFQSRDLSREQTASLRDMINTAFDKLKKLRKNSNEEFEQKAKENAELILKKINTIADQVADSRNLNGLFDTLKQMQSDLKKQRFTQELSNVIRDKMNETFQQVKEARRNHRNSRLTNRIKGLESAIYRMEKSARRDEEDLAFQNRRVQASEGKLEKQLREAKIVMIQERLNSKSVKLDDMHKTLKELKDRVKEDEDREIAREKAELEKAEQRAKREASRKAKQAARAKAAEEAQKLKEEQEAQAAAKAEETVVEEVVAMEETAENMVNTETTMEEVVVQEETKSTVEEAAAMEETIEKQAEDAGLTDEIAEVIAEETTPIVESPMTPVEAGVVDEATTAVEGEEAAENEAITEHAIEEVIAEGETNSTLIEELPANEDAMEMTSVITPLIEEETPSAEDAEAESLEVDDILTSHTDDSKDAEK